MLQQTRFLAGSVPRVRAARRASPARCDEHTLRERLIAEAAADPVRHVIVTVADWIADPDGLFVADFDLLTRVPGPRDARHRRTEARARVGIPRAAAQLVARARGGDDATVGGGRVVRPVLMTPAAIDDRRAVVDAPRSRGGADRRRAAAQGRSPQRRRRAARSRRGRLQAAAAVPVPGAAKCFGAAGIPYQTSDALPLAAEPTAAALDLVLDAVSSRLSRATRSSRCCDRRTSRFACDDGELTRESISALDRALSDARYLGELDAARGTGRRMAAHGAIARRRCAAAVGVAARELAPLAEPRPASAQLAQPRRRSGPRTLRPIADDDPFAARERRARAAIVDMLTRARRRVHAAHDDPAWTIDELASRVRRWIEEQTFVPDADARRGVQLLDDQAARYGDFDDITIVGLVEDEWPERPRRNIFYPPALLKALGWPSEKDRRAAADARFLDLLASASRRTRRAPTFTLDDEALVVAVDRSSTRCRARGCRRWRARRRERRARVRRRSAVARADRRSTPLDGRRAQLGRAARGARSPATRRRSTGTCRAAPARAWSVSALETYLDCPFKFFAQHVLQARGGARRRRGDGPAAAGAVRPRGVRAFFTAWQARGHRRDHAGQSRRGARRCSRTSSSARSSGCRTPKPALERTRLLGSSAAAGLGEAVLAHGSRAARRRRRAAARAPARRASSRSRPPTGRATIALRGKADRLDLLDDGTFRLIDYKLGWPPNRARALQLPIYSLCAEQRLAGASRPRRGRSAKRRTSRSRDRGASCRCSRSPADRDEVLAEAQQRLADTVDAIERGEFPPTPDDVYRCETCSFAAVCRKDYVGDV